MKYRIWDKEKQEYFKQGAWETFVWVDHDGKPFEIDITVHGQHMNPKDVSEKYDVEYSLDHVTDNNGKTIYVNDIINIRGFGGDFQKRVQGQLFIFYPGSAYEVIGNKNQNKELWARL